MSSEDTVVVVFRLQLFKPSETFVADQAGALRRYSPLLLGRELHGQPPPGVVFRSAPEASRVQKAVDALTANPKPFLKLIEQTPVSLVHAHFGIDAVVAGEIARSRDVPLIATFHGFDATTNLGSFARSGRPSLMRYAWSRNRLGRQAQLFICVSEHIRRHVLQLGYPEDKVVTHYIGTDTRRFGIDTRDASTKSPTILHVARLVEKKGTSYLLRAFAQVRRRCSDARLLIVGDGPLRPKLKELADALELGGSVEFLGSRSHPEVLRLMSAASVFALPSVTAANGDTEGLPISILEAAASGLPIVATLHAGIPEAVVSNVGGILVKERDVPALAAALCDLLLDHALSRSMGASARSHVESNFDLLRQAAKLERLYDRVRGSGC